MSYKLTLSTDDGEVLNEWTIGDENNEDADILYPISKMGPSVLAEDINGEIRMREGR